MKENKEIQLLNANDMYGICNKFC